MTNPDGPFSEARAWLLEYLKTAKFKNAQLEAALAEDWDRYEFDKAAYLLGAIWGRLRQMDSSLEVAKAYRDLVEAEFQRARPEPVQA